MQTKKYFRRGTAFLLALALCTLLTLPVLASGADDTVHIGSVSDLQQLAKNCALDTWSQGKTVSLDADLDLTGSDFALIPTFGGTFEGNGHTISGLAVTGAYSPAGLFGTVQESGIVQNLNVAGTVAPEGSRTMVGGIVGRNDGTIQNCSFSGNVTALAQAGGIAAVNEASGSIENCTVDGSVLARSEAGGVAGENEGTITTCTNRAQINTTMQESVSEDLLASLSQRFESLLENHTLDSDELALDVGGIAGYSCGSIVSCTNEGAVGYENIGYNIGGIVGRTDGLVTQCENYGAVLGRKDVGGIAGQAVPNIELNLSEGTLRQLSDELGTLQTLVSRAADTAGADADSIHSSLDQLNDYLTQATDRASALRNGVSTFAGEAADEAQRVSGVVDETLDRAQSIKDDGKLSIQESSDLLDYLADQPELNIPRVDDTTKESADALLSTLSGVSTQVAALNHETQTLGKDLFAQLEAISAQTAVIGELLADALEKAANPDASNYFRDISAETAPDNAAGQIVQCENDAAVCGESNVGGIAGAQSMESLLDPEDDLSELSLGGLNGIYERRAVVRGCTNRGAIAASSENVGGIIGHASLGLVDGCFGYGSVTSEDGSAVGGIVGCCSAAVQNSWAKCFLTGDTYVGGIVGCGEENTTLGTSCTVIDCRSMVEITEAAQYFGAIAGTDTGTFRGNVFVSDTLNGLDYCSVAGAAEPVSYEYFLTMDNVSEDFKNFTLSFVADGKVLKTVEFTYGASFGADIFPDIPAKENSYAAWPAVNLSSLTFDTVVSAVYTTYVSTLAGEPTREDGRTVFYVEGQFEEGDTLTCTVEEVSAAVFQAAGIDTESSSDNTTERWLLTLPQDGDTTHTVRYLPANADVETVTVCQNTADGWQQLETTTSGSYIVFEADGSNAELLFCAKEASAQPWVFITAGAGVVAVVATCVGTMRSKKKKTKQNTPDEA